MPTVAEPAPAQHTDVPVASTLPLENGALLPGRSRTFPTLVLPLNSLLAFDSAAVLAALEKSIKSPAHAEFLKGLPKPG